MLENYIVDGRKWVGQEKIKKNKKKNIGVDRPIYI